MSSLEGLDWMHHKGVVHRDLRPRHIMIIGLEQPVVRIIDYTTAIQLPHAEAPYHVRKGPSVTDLRVDVPITARPMSTSAISIMVRTTISGVWVACE